MQEIRALTAFDILTLAGGLLMVSAIVEFVISIAFCTRPAPDWSRRARGLAIAVAGARLLTRDNASLEFDAWFVTGIWLYFAITQTIIAGYTVAAIVGPDSDYCRKERGKDTAMKIGLIVMGFLLMAGVAGAQENQDSGGTSARGFEVVVGDFAYPLDPNDPVQGCIIASEINQDGETTVSYRRPDLQQRGHLYRRGWRISHHGSQRMLWHERSQ
jgi:hypothetical protein